MKKSWFLALAAIGVMGCAEPNVKSCEEQGKIECGDVCIKCEDGTSLDQATCSCKPQTQTKTCEEQGKVTCKGMCYDPCADNAKIDTATCTCPTKPEPQKTCEEQGKVTCKNACYEKCSGVDMDMSTCSCPSAPTPDKTCADQGKVECGGSCYEKCDNGAIRDAKTCQCPAIHVETCEEKGQITCGGKCVDQCTDGELDVKSCECIKAEESCEDKGQITCGGKCIDKCVDGMKLDTDKCTCVEDTPVDTKCKSNNDCAGKAGTPVCNVESGECVANTCGDGVVIAPELCEPSVASSFDKITCKDFDSTKNWVSGKPGCSDTCMITMGSCAEKEVDPAKCGNGSLDAGEECDPKKENSYSNKTCKELVGDKRYTADSKVICSDSCVLDTSACVVDLCGNGDASDPGEQCDFGLDSSGNVITEKSCASIDPAKWADGKATCTGCTKYVTTGCKAVEADDTRGLYWCQLMAPTNVTFDPSKTSETVTVQYAHGKGVTESAMKAQLVIGTDFSKVASTWVAEDAKMDAANDKFTATLTSQRITHFGGNDAYFTFRISPTGKDDDWVYCKKNSTNESVVDGKLEPVMVADGSTVLNKNITGYAKISDTDSANILSAFYFDDASKWTGGDPTKSVAADEGTGTFAVVASNYKCSNSNCYSTRSDAAGKVISLGNWSKDVNASKYIEIANVNVAGSTNVNLTMEISRANTTSSPDRIQFEYSTGGQFSAPNDLVLKTDSETGSKYVKYVIEIPNADMNGASKLTVRLHPYGQSTSALKFDNVIVSKNND